MESRKYQLKKQIIEALKSKDNDLYSLLKSQWAHRFGVESLEEVKSLELNEIKQKPNSVDLDADNQKINELQEESFKANKSSSIEDIDDHKKVIKNIELKPIMDESYEVSKIKSNETIGKEKSKENKARDSFIEDNSNYEIEALIPIPPKPKYSYLKKWLLKK